MTSAKRPEGDNLVPGHVPGHVHGHVHGDAPGTLRQVAMRIARMDRLPIPSTERLTATEKASAGLALTRLFD